MPKKTETPKEISSSKKTSPKAPMQTDYQMEISQLAYKYFVDRGCKHGFDEQDWLRAEKEVRGKEKKAGDDSRHKV